MRQSNFTSEIKPCHSVLVSPPPYYEVRKSLGALCFYAQDEKDRQLIKISLCKLPLLPIYLQCYS